MRASTAGPATMVRRLSNRANLLIAKNAIRNRMPRKEGGHRFWNSLTWISLFRSPFLCCWTSPRPNIHPRSTSSRIDFNASFKITIIHNITEIRKAAHPWPYILNRQHGSEHFALSAYFHLFLPVLLHLTMTDRPVNKPAKMPYLKFPCRTVLPDRHGTLSYHPTGPFFPKGRLLRG